jgi:hypothetical protein
MVRCSVAIPIPGSPVILYTRFDEKLNKHFVKCDCCETEVGLTARGDSENFFRHREGNKCQKLRAKGGKRIALQQMYETYLTL